MWTCNSTTICKAHGDLMDLIFGLGFSRNGLEENSRIKPYYKLIILCPQLNYVAFFLQLSLSSSSSPSNNSIPTIQQKHFKIKVKEKAWSFEARRKSRDLYKVNPSTCLNLLHHPSLLLVLL